MDPTEKGAVNYFMGMVMCQAFAAKCLDAPWLLHLDVFGGSITKIQPGRARPDLIGQIRDTSKWIVIESKGRSVPPDRRTKDKSKKQALRVLSVDGMPPKYHIGAITYFRKHRLEFHWIDPAPSGDGQQDPSAFDVGNVPEELWRYHYELAADLAFGGRNVSRDEGLQRALSNADVKVIVHPLIEEHLRERDWGSAKRLADQNVLMLRQQGFMDDGLQVVTGYSWQPHD